MKRVKMKKKLLIGLVSGISIFILIGCAQPSAVVTNEEMPALDEETYRLYVEDIMARQLQVLDDLDIGGVMQNPEYPPEIKELIALSIEVHNLNPPASFSDFHASYLEACSPVRSGTWDLLWAWTEWNGYSPQGEDRDEALEYLQTAADKLITGFARISLVQLTLKYPELEL